MTRLYQYHQLYINKIHQYRSPQNQLFRARHIPEQACQSNVYTLNYFILHYFLPKGSKYFDSLDLISY